MRLSGFFRTFRLVDHFGTITRYESPRRRRRRHRRGRQRHVLLGAVVIVSGVVLWLAVSYATWMLRPTSMSAGERSTEWLRTVPGGNWVVDEAEHFYFGSKAPRRVVHS